jgi:hypothetical protein
MKTMTMVLLATVILTGCGRSSGTCESGDVADCTLPDASGGKTYFAVSLFNDTLEGRECSIACTVKDANNTITNELGPDLRLLPAQTVRNPGVQRAGTGSTLEVEIVCMNPASPGVAEARYQASHGLVASLRCSYRFSKTERGTPVITEFCEEDPVDYCPSPCGGQE